MKNNLHKAFTLVELIVVITILAVLATVAFISFQGYTSSSRDSVRLADLKNISKSFEINRTKSIDFPLPDKKVDISASGTIFQYQGELSQNILEKNLNIFDGGLDPVTKKPYGYAVNLEKNKFQIIGFLENNQNVANNILSQSFADNSDKFVKSSGDNLGIILDENTNEIISDENENLEIDIESNTNNYSIIIGNKITKGNSDYIKDSLSFRSNTIESCKSILYNGNSKGDGIYTINPDKIKGQEFDVYCDMGNYGGGWTLLLANREDTNQYGYPVYAKKSLITLPNYDNWNYTAINSLNDLESGNINVVSRAIETMKFNDIRFECLGEECLGSGIGIYSHNQYSKLSNKTGVFNLIGDNAWPFDKYPLYKNNQSSSKDNQVPYNQLTIGGQCAAETSRPYEACVQIGIIGVDNYNFQNSLGLGVYGKEWYSPDELEINAPFGYMRHRKLENFNANVRIK